jgi:hypothetical protein
VVYTKRWVVELMLDLAGYTPDRDLQSLTIVEPAVGDGGFLVPIVERLIASSQQLGRPIESTVNAIAGYELDPASVEQCRRTVFALLEENGVSPEAGHRLITNWIRTADFLLDRDGMPQADIVVGNPPYIRLEDISSERAAQYRAKYSTMVGRADLYVAFFEAALNQLKPGGTCSYICADRWMLNQYGAQLRQLITSRFAVDAVIELHRADAFHTEVSAYPAITIIRRGVQSSSVVARAGAAAESLGRSGIKALLEDAATASGSTVVSGGLKAASVDGWFKGAEPWPCYSPERLTLLKRLEAEFYPLDSKGTGTRSGIGVASGSDKIFITKDADLVESDRLLPIALARDISSGRLNWSGHYLVNPWNGRGLISLDDYPRMQGYLGQHEDQLRGRHVGKKNPTAWYRTIDRVEAGLLGKPKLYIADIKERLNPVLDEGMTYPHHNLYFIQSAGWDHQVLGGLLLSNVAQFFIECYGVRMRGGYLRFQAQYLRRIRVPRPQDISMDQAQVLRRAFRDRDQQLATDVAMKLYGIDHLPQDDY